LAALEQAERLRGDAGEVVALTVGPADSEAALRKALMMGADRAVGVWSDSLLGADSFAVASVLAAAARRLEFDLILLGARSADTATEVVGAAIAEALELPLVTRVIGVEGPSDGSRMLAHRKLERGERESFEVSCPAVLTMETGVIEPRYCAPGWLGRVRRARVEWLRPEQIGARAETLSPRIAVLKVTPPRPRVKIGVRVAGLSLKDKLAVMRGAAKRPSGESSPAENRIVEGSPSEVALRLRKKLEEWLPSRPD
jgi:electron transfer flavoprotein beta subunit